MLSEASPAVVADRGRRRDRSRKFLDLRRRDAGDALDRRGIKGLGRRDIVIETGTARDRALGADDLEASLKRGCREPLLGRHRFARDRVPDQKAIAFKPDIAGAQEAAVAISDQKGGVGPVPHEVGVVGAVDDEPARQPERQRRIGAGTNPQPQIGVARRAGPARIDHGKPRALRPRGADRLRLGKPDIGGVVSPEQDQFGIAIVCRRQAAAEGEGVGVVLVPIADLGGETVVRTAEATDEALDPVEAV